MRPTSIRMLLLVAAAAGMLGWVFAEWVDAQGRLPQVPWLAVVVIWVVAGFVGAWALVARKRLRPEDPQREPMAPLVAARTAALALAGSRSGAVVMGIYGGMALRLLQETGVAAGRERLIAAAAASAGGLVLAILSLWLEHICRLPEDPEGTTRMGAAGESRGPLPGAHARQGTGARSSASSVAPASPARRGPSAGLSWRP